MKAFGPYPSSVTNRTRTIIFVSHYGSFQRRFVLPDSIKANKVVAGFKDGILMVTVPKAEEAKEKNVKIKIN
jgi:HSP20 family molecular chaperone IbpA